jgi:N-acetyltransferase
MAADPGKGSDDFSPGAAAGETVRADVLGAVDQALFAPVVLAGSHVRLDPMRIEHLPGLTAAGADPSIWQWYSVDGQTPAAMRSFVEDALDMQARGVAVPFTVFAEGGTIAGSTRFAAIEPRHRRAEIGWTFLAPRWQRTGINTEMKSLMLRHAFEAWGLQRVEFKTDSLNRTSRAALARIGATEEGTLRNHMVTYTGRTRHSVYYSITREDWPRVQAHLQALMDSRAQARAVAARPPEIA